jgi:hypothetical protein
MFGNIGGAIAPLVVGYAVEKWSSWEIPFYVTAGIFGFGVIMWLLIDPDRSVISSVPQLSSLRQTFEPGPSDS